MGTYVFQFDQTHDMSTLTLENTLFDLYSQSSNVSVKGFVFYLSWYKCQLSQQTNYSNASSSILMKPKKVHDKVVFVSLHNS